MISIIIPIYNSQNYIYDCLSSIAKQSYKDYEIIIVNDGSSDNSVSIVEKFRQEHPFLEIVLIHQENKGQSSARNTGIKQSKGNYLYFLDSDDTIFPETLEELYSLSSTYQLDVAIGENNIVNCNKIKYISAGIDEDIICDKDKIIRAYTENKWYNVVWNKLIKTSIIKDNNIWFPEGYIFEDELWSFILATKISSLGIIRKPLYNYNIRDNSTMTSNLGAKRWFGMSRILPLMKDYIVCQNLTKNYNIARFFILKIVMTLSGLNDNNALNYDTFIKLRLLNYASLRSMKENGYLSHKELLAYYYLNVPGKLSFLYYKLTYLYYRIKAYF